MELRFNPELIWPRGNTPAPVRHIPHSEWHSSAPASWQNNLYQSGFLPNPTATIRPRKLIR